MKHMNSIIAIAGPPRELAKIQFRERTFDKIVRFDVPDDHGEFPDMGAYESRSVDGQGNVTVSHDWEKFSSDMEDSALYPYMLKCADAVDDYLTKEASLLERLSFQNIMTVMNGHKFGGKVFAVAGFVKYEANPFGGKHIIMPGM